MSPLTSTLGLLTEAKRACWMARILHARADGVGSFAPIQCGELLHRHARHLQVDVDAVEEGVRDALLVLGDHAR
jgi:hypothetical protein